MEDKIYTLREMKKQCIYTEEYQQMTEAVTVIGTLELKARSSDSGMLRMFFSLSDGRRIMTPVFWWQRYAGLCEMPVGTVLELTYVPGKNGYFNLKKAVPV